MICARRWKLSACGHLSFGGSHELATWYAINAALVLRNIVLGAQKRTYSMTDNVLYGIDFSAKRVKQEAFYQIDIYGAAMTTEQAQLTAISQAMAPDACFIITDHVIYPEMSIEERVRRSIYHGAGLPYPKDSA